ncbi:MAG TPA: adenylate/guanylate cyclase domain-containing protein [Burkholderiales bacterium]|nr:adenylate/guanylate cyclase domain-containing protein [Burkholderiales bacterium]
MTTASQRFAIMFADVSGSTSLYEKLGDQRALAAIEAVLSELRKSTILQDGRVVKTIGDEVMAVFPSVDGAMQAACDMQSRVAAIPQADNTPLAIRVGFHYGPAIEDKGDYFGDAVNTAARMAGLAKSGQIITSGQSVEALSPLLKASTREIDAFHVKGKQDEIRIFEVIWHDSADLTAMAERDISASTAVSSLTLTCGACALTLGVDQKSVSLGRDAGNDMMVPDKMASRVHCKIEFRRGNFFLVDQSTNGTFVTVGSDAEVLLKREQIMLRGNGVICLGHTASSGDGERVSFAST